MNARTVYLDDIEINVAMARKRMSRAELCKLSGINISNFSTMMKRRTVRPKTAGAIADALGVDVSEILANHQG